MCELSWIIIMKFNEVYNNVLTKKFVKIRPKRYLYRTLICLLSPIIFTIECAWLSYILFNGYILKKSHYFWALSYLMNKWLKLWNNDDGFYFYYGKK